MEKNLLLGNVEESRFIGIKETTVLTVKRNGGKMTDNEEQRPTIKFEDEGALDTYIAMSDLSSSQAKHLREKVEKFGYNTPVPVPEPEDSEN